MKDWYLLVAIILLTPCIGHAQIKPVCGLSNNQNPYLPGTGPSGGSNNYTTFTPPSSVGGSYVDFLTKCTVTRITNDGVSTVYYSSISAISEADDWIMVLHPATGGLRILCWQHSGCAPGAIVVPESSFPSSASADSPWDRSTPNKFYFQGSSSQLMSGTITGLPGCLATNNCTIASSTVHTFSEYAGGITFSDEPDITPDGSTLLFVGYNTTGSSTMDIATWNLNTSTKTVWHTTSCMSTPSGQPGCIHKLQQTNSGEAIVTYTNNGSGVEQGTHWYHGAGPTDTLIQNATQHLDAGLDKSGNEVFVQDRIDSSIGTDPCPSGQWSGSGSGGGASVSLLNSPTTGTCWLNKDYAGPHISYRGSAAHPWVLMSMADAADGRGGCPEAAGCTVNCTQVNTTTSGTCWYPYETEHLLAQIDNANGLVGLYRLAVGRSRTNANFWAQNTGTLSPDQNYVAFNSNMAFPNVNCANSSTAGCADVYVISGPGGSPLLSSGAPEPPTNIVISELRR